MPYRCIVCTHKPEDDPVKCECCEENPHCSGCAQPVDNCWCCSECEAYPCTCNGEIHDEQTTYDQGTFCGKPYTRQTFYGLWREAWPFLSDQHSKLDPCQVAADFYLLDAIRHAVLNKEHECPKPCAHHNLFSDSYDLDSIRRDANEKFLTLTDYLDTVFCQYVEMACGGELRHHSAMGGQIISTTRRVAWADWRSIHDAFGHECLLDMADLFKQFGSGAFGGARWGYVARMLHDRLTGKITKEQWVDRVFALVHNGGVFLNKLEWAVKNKREYSLHSLQATVLPAQANDAWRTLLMVSSDSTRRLWDEYWLTTNGLRLRSGVAPAINPRRYGTARVLCSSCASNPFHGHLMSCSYWMEDRLSSAHMKQKIDEEYYSSFHWTVWQMDPDLLPIGPNGEVRIQPHERYILNVYIEGQPIICHRRYTMSGTALANDLIPLKPIYAESAFEQAWAGVLPEEYRWRLVLMEPQGLVTLGSFESPVRDKEAIVKEVIPLGLLLPLVMTDCDWSRVQGEKGEYTEQPF